ncbi:MAG: hypothetical protein LC733_02535, partial [Actinobacteria bacterium]|nr:hypothetical protein [Actinomycetota bacterium]
YRAVLRRGSKRLERTAPPAGDRIAFYAGSEPHLVFAALRTTRGTTVPEEEAVSSEIVLPGAGAASISYEVHRHGGRGGHVRLEAGSLTAEPGTYDIGLRERGELIGSTTVHVGQGETHSLDLPDMVFCPPAYRSVSHPGATGVLPSLRPDDLVPQPDPAAAPPVVDPNPALVLSLLGTAAIAARAPYRTAVGKLVTFDDLSASASAIYVLGEGELMGEVAVRGGDPLPLTFVEGLDGVRHARIDVEAGAHDLHLFLDGQSEVIVATHAFPGRVTLVVLARGAPPTIRQFAPVPGHLTGAAADADVVASTRFGELVQRRFHEDRPVVADLQEDDQSRWERLCAGEWPDPLTALVAAYELVRRGALARGPDDLLALVNRLESRFGTVPDLAILAALASSTSPPYSGTPLVSDGVAASGPRPRDGFVPNERCGWTVWQRWGSR